MAEEDQRSSLAPATRYGRSDDEEHGGPISINHSSNKKSEETTSKCLVYVLLLIVIASAVLLSFSSIFIRVEAPSMRFAYVTVKNPSYDNRTSSAFVNGTLNGEIRIKNTNFGTFVYQWATAVVLSRNVIIGEGEFHGGRVSGRDSTRFAVTIDVSSVAALDTNTTARLSNDVNSGVVEVTSYSNVTGKIHLLNGFIKRRTTTIMNCTVSLNVVTNTVASLLCD